MSKIMTESKDIEYFLTLACRQCNWETIKDILCEHKDIDLYDSFVSACAFGHVKLVEWLYFLQSSIDDGYHGNALICAASNGHIDTVKWLYNNFRYNDNIIQYAFKKSCKSEKISVYKWFVLVRHDSIITDSNDFGYFDKQFRESCFRWEIELVEFLSKIFPSRYKIISTDKSMIEFNVNENSNAMRSIRGACCLNCFEKPNNIDFLRCKYCEFGLCIYCPHNHNWCKTKCTCGGIYSLLNNGNV
tara:strand:+ start:3926 stop:4660 length:735 start_codon:yes stop_codon:yes gene_type:complete